MTTASAIKPVKRRDVEIVQRDGRFLVLLAREPLPLSLSQFAKDAGFQTAALCKMVGISERHLRRVFENGLGISPKEWLRQERMVAARMLLRGGSSVKHVSMVLGFSSPKMLTRDFHAFYGLTPTGYQRKEFAFIAGAVK